MVRNVKKRRHLGNGEPLEGELDPGAVDLGSALPDLSGDGDGPERHVPMVHIEARPINPELWKQYCSWFPPSGQPAFPNAGCWMVMSATLVVAIPFYTSEHWPYAFALGCRSNPVVKDEVVREAVLLARGSMAAWQDVAGRTVIFADPEFPTAMLGLLQDERAKDG